MTTGRLTWQANEKQKFSFSYDREHRCQCFSEGDPFTGAATLISTPEATRNPVYDPRLYGVT